VEAGAHAENGAEPANDLIQSMVPTLVAGCNIFVQSARQRGEARHLKKNFIGVPHDHTPIDGAWS
jgi:hypothetical protein